MVEADASTVPDYKAFRTVTTPSSCSMLNSNLDTKEGTSFVTIKNTAQGGVVNLYDSNIVNQEHDSVKPTLSPVCHSSDGIRAQFLKISGTHYVVVCHLACCLVYNANMTRKLFSFDITQAI